MSGRHPEPADAWLTRFTAEEWIGSALSELELARSALEGRRGPEASVALRRAAGMALNGALRVVPREAWGRSYVEHLEALQTEPTAPEVVRCAARELLEFSPRSGGPIRLATRSADERLLEAARTVMAHAYAIVHGRAGR